MKDSSVWKGTLLVAGTTIGGGMLALPVLTSLGGFVPSLAMYFICWLFMASTGLLFLEVSLSMKKEANIITMAETTLGLFGKVFAWVLYLFLFYCLTLAYVVGSGGMVAEFFNHSITETIGSLLFVIFFAPFVYLGPRVIGRVNSYLMIALGSLFLLFVFLGFRHVDYNLLTYKNWGYSLQALPVAFTAFAYQGIVPTLVTYLNHDKAKIRKTILIGSFIPLITYIIWQWLILGIVPTFGAGGLNEALTAGENAVIPLRHFIQSPWIYVIGQFFAFIALLTSFFGVTVGLLDFLADGLRVEKTAIGKFFLCLLIFIPPLVMSYLHPGLFLEALDLAGGFGSALLLGLLPILMVWKGRYQLGYQTERMLPGGRGLLGVMILFVVFELIVGVLLQLGYFNA